MSDTPIPAPAAHSHAGLQIPPPAHVPAIPAIPAITPTAPRPAPTQIALLSESSEAPDSAMQDLTNALQIHVTRDFAPIWGKDAQLVYVPKGKKPPPGMWWIAFLDNSDQQDALGYHDLTHEGLPIGKVFIKSTIANGGKWSVTGCHELDEMLVDPTINITVLDDKTMRLYSYEVCDAVEADSDGYPINGIQMSNFITPAWFERFQTGRPGVHYDYRGLLKAPFTLRPDGYVSYMDVRSSRGWQQQFASEARARFHRDRPHVGSRRERRRTPTDQWVLSAVSHRT